MPQSRWQFVEGYVRLTFDTLTQRLFERNVPADHPLFQASSTTARAQLASQTAIVTGANTGIGLETARYLTAAGATVVLACRNPAKANVAADDIRRTVPYACLELAKLDLSSMESVREFTDSFMRSATNPRPLHMLVHNGGVMGLPRNEPEAHFTVNHVASFLLTLRLLPSLSAATVSTGARIVLVSSLTYLISDLHLDDVAFRRRPYSWMTAYANSKLSMVLFMHALQKRLRGSAISVNVVHPGESTTDVARNLGSVWMTLHKRVGALFLLSPREAARTSVYAAAAVEVGGESGRVFHAINRTLDVPAHLAEQGDAELLWDVSIEAAGAGESDFAGLLEILESDGGAGAGMLRGQLEGAKDKTL